MPHHLRGQFPRAVTACLFLASFLAFTRSLCAGDSLYSDDQKGWALGTCAVLTQVNQRSHRELGGRPVNEASVKATKALLSRWWEVNSREDLLRALDWTDEQGGHRKEFNALVTLSPEKLDALKTQSEGNAELANKIAIAREYGKSLGAKSLVGWDYSRYVSLCGWGTLAGYLSEDEAWEHIMPIARKLQQTFTSWEDLGENYLIGRRFWSLANTEKTGAQYTEAVKWLEMSPDSPWKKYPWNLDLEAKPGGAKP